MFIYIYASIFYPTPVVLLVSQDITGGSLVMDKIPISYYAYKLYCYVLYHCFYCDIAPTSIPGITQRNIVGPAFIKDFYIIEPTYLYCLLEVGFTRTYCFSVESVTTAQTSQRITLFVA